LGWKRTLNRNATAVPRHKKATGQARPWLEIIQSKTDQLIEPRSGAPENESKQGPVYGSYHILACAPPFSNISCFDFSWFSEESQFSKLLRTKEFNYETREKKMTKKGRTLLFLQFNGFFRSYLACFASFVVFFLFLDSGLPIFHL
jgi:hypothetical protein